MPAPEHPEFCRSVAEEMERIVEVTRGRAFLLFTSWRNLTRVHDLLADRLPYPVLLQGEQPRSALLQEFKERKNAVLFATQSFWEGVDVVGPALSAVVIDKLPFAAPTEPVVEARIERIKKLGGDPFQSYQVPAAVIALKQGLGRLIRTREDFGVLSVLDPRLRTRHYGKIFLDSLPEMPQTASLEEVRQFFAEREAEAPAPRRKPG
jgi:ATP-dependent DNA helicase DinG